MYFLMVFLLWFTEYRNTIQIKMKIMALHYNPTINQLLHCISIFSFIIPQSSILPSFPQPVLLFLWSLISVWLELILCLHEIGSSSMHFFPLLFPLLLLQADSLKSCCGQLPTSAVWSSGIWNGGKIYRRVCFHPSSPTKQNKTNRKLERKKK